MEYRSNRLVLLSRTSNTTLFVNKRYTQTQTLEKDKKFYAVGGRVLNFIVTSDNFSEAKKKILLNLDKLNWQGGFYRKDIGWRVIKKV